MSAPVSRAREAPYARLLFSDRLRWAWGLMVAQQPAIALGLLLRVAFGVIPGAAALVYLAAVWFELGRAPEDEAWLRVLFNVPFALAVAGIYGALRLAHHAAGWLADGLLAEGYARAVAGQERTPLAVQALRGFERNWAVGGAFSLVFWLIDWALFAVAAGSLVIMAAHIGEFRHANAALGPLIMLAGSLAMVIPAVACMALYYTSVAARFTKAHGVGEAIFMATRAIGAAPGSTLIAVMFVLGLAVTAGMAQSILAQAGARIAMPPDQLLTGLESPPAASWYWFGAQLALALSGEVAGAIVHALGMALFFAQFADDTGHAPVMPSRFPWEGYYRPPRRISLLPD